MAAKKKTSRKRAGKKTKKKTTRSKPVLQRLEADLPPTLRDFSRRVRRGLGDLEKRIEKDGREARRRGLRMLREASHRLGQLEAKGEREWKRQTTQAKRATVRVLKQLERAIEPPKKKRTSRKKKTSRRSAAATA